MRVRWGSVGCMRGVEIRREVFEPAAVGDNMFDALDSMHMEARQKWIQG